jgi:hypothetical protein
MDDSVLAAIAKWPNVPAVFGWLALTARGEWRIKGQTIANAAIREFIGRNYAADERGRWFFQNGPQRVYVELEVTPWVYRLDADGALRAHTGARPRALLACGVLDEGRFVLQTDLGAGIVDDRDTAAFVRVVADAHGVALDDHALQRWLSGDVAAFASPALLRVAGALRPFERLRAAALAQRFGFVRAPEA